MGDNVEDSVGEAKLENKREGPSSPAGSPEVESSAAAPNMESKLKRLLLAAKRSINDLKSKLDDSRSAVERQECVISTMRNERERLVELAKRAQRRIEELETEAEEARDAAQEAAEKAATAATTVQSNPACSGMTPVHIEHRFETASGRRWCLASFSETEGGTQGSVGCTAWLEEHDLYRLVEAQELPFELPPLSPNAEELDRLQKTAGGLRKVQEDFRRYRVRSEVMRKQTQAELERVSANNLKYKQHNIVGDDTRSQLDHALSKIDELCTDQSRLQRIESHFRKEVEKLRSKLAHAEAAAQQWQQRYEQRAQCRAAQSSIDSSSASGAPTQFDKLRREYDNYRKRALAMVEQKDRELVELREKLASATETATRAQRANSTINNDGQQNADADSFANDNITNISGEETEAGASSHINESESQVIEVEQSSQIEGNGISGGTVSASVQLPKRSRRRGGGSYIASVNEVEGNDHVKHMEAAIATVLRFNQADMDFLSERRANAVTVTRGWTLW